MRQPKVFGIFYSALFWKLLKLRDSQIHHSPCNDLHNLIWCCLQLTNLLCRRFLERKMWEGVGGDVCRVPWSNLLRHGCYLGYIGSCHIQFRVLTSYPQHWWTLTCRRSSFCSSCKIKLYGCLFVLLITMGLVVGDRAWVGFGLGVSGWVDRF